MMEHSKAHRAREGEVLVEYWRQLEGKLRAVGVELLTVSKYASDAQVGALIAAGALDFAESRPQQLRDRSKKWPACRWHMIGPLQKNKAKYIGAYAAMWHSCDTLEGARAVAKYVKGRVLPVLIQVNIAENPDQRGIAPEELDTFAAALAEIPALKFHGLMAMAPKDGDARALFAELRGLHHQFFPSGTGTLCMGMSGDYLVAIEEGATMVRLGSAIFCV